MGNNVRNWSISKNDIKLIPAFYPLGGMYKVVVISLETLSARLLQCIRTKNIAIDWDPVNPTRLCCNTNTLVRFEINIWKQHPKSHNKDSEAQFQPEESILENVIIEIRRHDGDCVNFHHFRRELFSFILNGEDLSNDTNAIKRITCPTNLPHKIRPLVLDNLINVLNSVIMACDMILKENPIDTAMGLQMLTFLTEPNSINRVFAGHVSNFILVGQDILGSSIPTVRDIIFEYVANERNCVEHHYALQIFSNCLQYCTFHQDKNNQDVTNFDAYPNLEKWNLVIPTLILDIEDSEKSPHVGYNATKCLRSWYRIAGTHADLSYKEEILSVLERVSLFGERWYMSLAIESKNLKMSLS